MVNNKCFQFDQLQYNLQMQSNDSIELLNIKNNEKHHLTGPELMIRRGWLNVCISNKYWP